VGKRVTSRRSPGCRHLARSRTGALYPGLVDRSVKPRRLAEEVGEFAAAGERRSRTRAAIVSSIRKPHPLGSSHRPVRARVVRRPRSAWTPRGTSPAPHRSPPETRRPPAGSRSGRTAPQVPAPPEVGGRLVGIPRDPLEQQPVGLVVNAAPARPASSRSAIRMSKNISEASTKRSVTATAAESALRTRRPRRPRSPRARARLAPARRVRRRDQLPPRRPPALRLRSPRAPPPPRRGSRSPHLRRDLSR
jgi:hypothetical protein